MSTTTRQALREHMIDVWGLGRRGTNTGASASAITDDVNFGAHRSAEGIDVGCEVMIVSGTRAGDISRLASRPKLTTGVANLDPGLGGALSARTTTINDAGGISAADTTVIVTSATGFPSSGNYIILVESERMEVTAGQGTTTWTIRRGVLNTLAATHVDTSTVTLQDAFQLLYQPLRFDSGQYSVHDAITQAMAEFAWERRMVPVTLVPDGDMLAAATSSWSEVGSGALSKVAATFPLGERVLRMTGVAANDYIKSGTIPVEPETDYYLEVTGMIASIGAAADTGTLVLYDETNAASITLDSDKITIDRFEPEILLHTSVSTPAGCKQVTIRLEADNAGDIIDWTNVIFRRNSLREFVLTDRPQHILEVGRLFATSVSDWQERGQRLTDNEIPCEVVQLDSGMWAIHTRENLAGKSVWYEEYVRPAALTVDTDTTTLPKEDLAAVATELLLRPLQSDKQWKAIYAKVVDRAAYARAKYQSLRVTRKSAPLAYAVPYA